MNSQEDFENDAADLIADGDFDGARGMLTQISNASAVAAVSAYHTLFDTLVARYHDGYQMQVRCAHHIPFNFFERRVS